MIRLRYNGFKENATDAKDESYMEEDDTLTRENTLYEPQIYCFDKQERQYTVIMVDPDTTPPSWLHWMVMNINEKTSNEIVPYYPPLHTLNLHRYLFYILGQFRTIYVWPSVSRHWFSLRKFMDEYGLYILQRINVWVTH